jgi:S-(hydroxymethyl)glutathione dehydrogenase/alcohol dehydrogenase
MSLGATDFINPLDLGKDKSIVDVLVEKTDGGCEHTLWVERVAFLRDAR